MDISELKWIHTCLDACNKSNLNLSLPNQKSEKKTLTLIFDSLNQQLKQDSQNSSEALKSERYKELSEKIEFITKIEDDIQALYFKCQHPKKKSFPRKIANKIANKIKKLFLSLTNPTKKIASLPKLFREIKESLEKQRMILESEKITREPILEEVTESFPAQANKWLDFISQASVSGHRQADAYESANKSKNYLEVRNQLHEMVTLIEKMIKNSSHEESKAVLNKFPQVLALIVDNPNELNLVKISHRCSQILEAIKQRKAVSPLIANAEIRNKLANLLGEDEKDFKEIKISHGEISERSFQHPESQAGFFKLDHISPDSFKKHAPKISFALTKANGPTGEVSCRGLFISLTEGQKLDNDFWQKLIELSESDLPYISLSFDTPIDVHFSPDDLDKKQTERFFQALKKIEIRTPVHLHFHQPLDPIQIVSSFPFVKGLNLSLQATDYIEKMIPLFKNLEELNLANTEITDLHLARWQYDGLFSQLKKLDLRGNPNLSSNILHPLSALVEKQPSIDILFPKDLQQGNYPLTQHINHLKLLLINFGVTKDLVYSPDETAEFNAEMSSQWLKDQRYQDMPNIPYITALKLAHGAEVTNDTLPMFIKKFPNLKELDLRGCQNITDDLFNHSTMQAWLKKGSVLNLIETKVSAETKKQIHRQHPELNLPDFTIIVKGIPFDFVRENLKLLPVPYWRNNFAPGAILEEETSFELKDDQIKSIADPELFAIVAKYVNTGEFDKKTLKPDEADNLFALSSFFGKEFEEHCWKVLISILAQPSVTLAEVLWISDLAERYTNRNMKSICNYKLQREQNKLAVAPPITDALNPIPLSINSNNLLKPTGLLIKS